MKFPHCGLRSTPVNAKSLCAVLISSTYLLFRWAEPAELNSRSPLLCSLWLVPELETLPKFTKGWSKGDTPTCGPLVTMSEATPPTAKELGGSSFRGVGLVNNKSLLVTVKKPEKKLHFFAWKQLKTVCWTQGGIYRIFLSNRFYVK